MTLSIIIATYNRDTLLRECLAVLARQPFAQDDEVIVVDNGSTDSTFRVVHDMRSAFPVPLRYLVEETPGKCHALTRALSAAHGDVLAFTDDDVIVGDRWLTAIRRAFQNPELMLLAGRVEPRWERPAPRWLRWRNDNGTYTALTSPLAILHYGAEEDLEAQTAIGANMVIRRSAVDAVGGFPLHLGKLRGTLLSGEDHDICQRIKARGFKARYVPAVRVHHWVPASRMRIAYYLRWYFWSGITNAALAAGASRRSFYWIKQALAESLRALGSAARLQWPATVEHGTQAAFAVGYLAERWRMVNVPGTREPEGPTEVVAA